MSASQPATSGFPSPASANALTLISNELDQIYSELQKGEAGHATVHLRRLDRYDATLSQDLVSTEFKAKNHAVKYSWPGKTADEAWRFACACAVLAAIYAAMASQTTVTKRDIFYSDPDLFGNQSVVDRFIDDIAHTCQIPRAALNVTASPKGLFAIAGSSLTEPQSVSLCIPSLEHICWTMVVEKEATFKTLFENGFHRVHRAGPGMIVTAKGYPDLGTRQFIRSCLASMPISIPVFGLFDYDPYGVDILKCYHVGSKASAGDASLNIPEIRWLGIRSDDMFNLPPTSSFLALTQADRKRAVKLMNSMIVIGSGVVEELREGYTELQRMLVLGRKAEIQILGDDLCRWAERKMLDIMSK